MKSLIDSEQVDQLEEDLYEFLSNYGAHIDTDNEKVRICVEKLALISLKTALEETSYTDDDEFLDFKGDMDTFGFEDDNE